MTIPYIILFILIIVLLAQATSKSRHRNTVIFRAIRILLTNWIHLVGIYITISLTTLIDNYVDHGENARYIQASALEILLSAPIILIFYGIKYIGIGILLIFISDMVAVISGWTRLLILTMTQWIIICSAVIYFGINEGTTTAFSAIFSVAFLLTQLIRTNQIRKIKLETLPT